MNGATRRRRHASSRDSSSALDPNSCEVPEERCCALHEGDPQGDRRVISRLPCIAPSPCRGRACSNECSLRLLEARLSADLGRPGRRHEGARDRPGPRGHRYRLGRMQRALLSDRRSCRRHGGRPQRRPYRARQAQDLRARKTCRTTRRSSASSVAPTRAPTSASTIDGCAPKLDPATRGLLGQAPRVRPSARSASSPATSIATACSAISSARATRWPACTGSTRRSFSRRKTLEEQRALYEERLAPIFDKPLVRWMMKQPASLYGLGIPPAQYKALAADSPGGIGERAEPAGRAAGLRLCRRRQLLRLAGVRPPLCAGSEPVPAALSAGARISTPSAAAPTGCATCSVRSPRRCARRRRRASTAMCCSTPRTG